MKAYEWIARQKAQMQEKEGKEFWSEPELEEALADAVVAVQQDIPIFTKQKRFTTEPGVSAYEIGEDLIDGLSLRIAGTLYRKVGPGEFYAQDEGTPVYMIDGTKIIVSPEPKVAEDAVFEYRTIKPQGGGDAEIVLPRPYLEAMRRYFLFRVYEKQPDRKSRELASYYLRLYEEEILKRQYTLNPRVRSVRTGYRRV